jgi:CTP-dependent riboflavin kinase
MLVDQRLEDVRVSEQAADITRQEKLLKLISHELTKNTTRVVEMAVKQEVQNSVLPSLENITKTEVKAALNGQIAKGLGESMNQVCPFFGSTTF